MDHRCDMVHQQCLPMGSRFKSDICNREGLEFNSAIGPNRISQVLLLPEILECARPVLLGFPR